MNRSALAPFAGAAAKPMCQYPQYPHYSGTGDVKLAASYRCVAH